MTNILILTAGTRVKLVEYFKMLPNVKVVCTDASLNAPALYFGDAHYQMPCFTDPTYLERVLEVCEAENIDAVLPIIDTTSFILSQHKQRFTEKGIKVITSPAETVALTFDKRQLAKFCRDNQLPTIPTFDSLAEFEQARVAGLIDFPVFVKPAIGSGSIDNYKVHNMSELKNILANKKDMIIQAFIKGTEYGVDVYCDLETGELVDFFVKEKLLMRSGETDKARSANPQPVLPILQDLVRRANFHGPVDVEFFYDQGQWLISEINTRFGGGYPFAQACGKNYPQLIVNNINGKRNHVQNFAYPQDVILMKYPEIAMVTAVESNQRSLKRHVV
ncbi:ATP-grasp domain-containing protein [Lapidilactobacillus bayanensis]|uniref:ATP-grasp domain-containing protein n=1 Tax=Lapidilactobacillus bayanensis TaxID=2485998 RepID=UPI000F7986F6|nr:ATP-grasp domain-containing protein [Lapidilactobacillus bayanensis]